MRAVVQRVCEGRVLAGGKVLAEIGQGLVVLLGVSVADGTDDVDYIVKKITGLRIFDDVEGKLNLSVKEIGGEVLIVSQFTLYGDVRKGRRPSFVEAAPILKAKDLYQRVIADLKRQKVKTEAGKFQAKMIVKIIGDGPVTILLDSQNQLK